MDTKVTKLKIKFNPFAKAFQDSRDRSVDINLLGSHHHHFQHDIPRPMFSRSSLTSLSKQPLDHLHHHHHSHHHHEQHQHQLQHQSPNLNLNSNSHVHQAQNHHHHLHQRNHYFQSAAAAVAAAGVVKRHDFSFDSSLLPQGYHAATAPDAANNTTPPTGESTTPILNSTPTLDGSHLTVGEQQHQHQHHHQHSQHPQQQQEQQQLAHNQRHFDQSTLHHHHHHQQYLQHQQQLQQQHQQQQQQLLQHNELHHSHHHQQWHQQHNHLTATATSDVNAAMLARSYDRAEAASHLVNTPYERVETSSSHLLPPSVLLSAAAANQSSDHVASAKYCH